MTLETQIFYTVALSLLSVEAYIVQNCTTNSCDLKTCANTTQACMQKCYTSNCRMSCVSPIGCNMQCINGGCSRLFCDVPITKGIYSYCAQQCLENCKDMKCKSRSCNLQCLRDSCNMTCHGAGYPSGCFPTCRGRGCQIDVHSTMGETSCERGSCVVRFSKSTSGTLYCPAGNCTFICAKGQSCSLSGSCSNCTGPLYVDDPFATNNATSNAPVACKDNVLFYLYGVVIIFSILFV